MPAFIVAPAPPALVTALAASIANPAHGWRVQSRVVTTGPVLDDAVAGLTGGLINVSLWSPVVTRQIGDRAVPLALTYIALYAAGELTGAMLYLSGAQFSSGDPTLAAAVFARADAWLTAEAPAITAAINAT